MTKQEIIDKLDGILKENTQKIFKAYLTGDGSSEDAFMDQLEAVGIIFKRCLSDAYNLCDREKTLEFINDFKKNLN